MLTTHTSNVYNKDGDTLLHVPAAVRRSELEV